MTLFAITATIGLALTGNTVLAVGTTTKTAATQTEQVRLQNIITKGDQEINRRLASLNTLTSKINAATKLTGSDKATLTNEVTSTISGLTSLKSKLDADTTIEAAKTDVQSIYSEYRVYALVTPKIHLIKVADDIQAVDMRLTTLASMLQSRIASDKTAGKDVSALQAKLDDMNSNISSAKAIASKIEAAVISLQPADYNSDHTLLSGDAVQLKTAHGNNQTAISDAKSIAASLKDMK